MSSEVTETASTSGAVPTCYRHPGRETHIRCQRCGRPICPECMIPASVGFQCPDDVRAGAATVREPRTALGGRLRADGAWLTRIIVGVCVVVFIAQQVSPDVTSRFVMTSARPPFIGVPAGQWYRLVTSAFLHGGTFHLLVNMYALWIFGPQLEALMGRIRFGALYVAGLLGGAATSYVFAPVGQTSLGASGAIFALFGAYMVIAHKMGRDMGQLWVLLLANLAIGFVPSFGIDWHDHIGGFVVGAALGAVLVYAPRPRLKVLFSSAVAAALVLSVAAVAWRTGDVQQVPATKTVACEVVHPGGGDGYLGCLG